MNIAVLSCSLHPQSRSFVLAKQAVAELEKHQVQVELHDLREFSLDFCDGKLVYDVDETKRIRKIIDESTAVLLAVPIYNFDVNAAAKNLLEIAMRSWNNKLVGFLCAAGGQRSYMSIMSLANSLMLDFRCLIVPRFVYATGADFGDDRLESMYIASDLIQERIVELVQTTVTLASALESSYIHAD